MSNGDRDVLRRLAARWMEIAAQPVMAERKRQWTALKDLKAERPMVLFETWTLEHYVEESEIECEDRGFRIRDVYRIAGDRPRLRQWAEMVKGMIGC